MGLENPEERGDELPAGWRRLVHKREGGKKLGRWDSACFLFGFVVCLSSTLSKGGKKLRRWDFLLACYSVCL